MWKLAYIAGNEVTIYETTGTRKFKFKNFEAGVSTLLTEGWEPFAAFWFRMKIS